MAFPPRFDSLDFEVAPDEELPDYEAATAPEYDREEYETPLHTYHLRQVDRKLQMFVPYGPSTSASYKVTSRGARFFSKKPEIDVWRMSHGTMAEEYVAGIWFDTDGPLPWRPRAHFSHSATHGVCTHRMESRNFSDWTVMIGGTTYVWTLEARPDSLVFSEKSSSDVIARFTFSAQGTTASGGAEAGGLIIYRDVLSMDNDGVGKIMCGLVVAIAHFKKMGRHYWNEPRSLLTGGHLPSHRGSIATCSTL